MAQGLALAIELADGRTIVGLPGPEDQDRLAAATSGPLTIQLGETSSDTEGHQASDELMLDVEGHAMTLRLPTSADAAAIRSALVAGTLTATVVAAAAFTAMQGQANQPVPAAVPVTESVSAPNIDLAIRREQRLAEGEAVPAAGSGSLGTSDTSNSGGSESRESRSGPLEFDR